MKTNKKEIKRREIFDSLKDKQDLTTLEQNRLLKTVETSKLSGKLEDFWSLSSSPLTNQFCVVRMKNEKMICNKCFSTASFSYKPSLKLKLAYNSDVLSTILFDDDVWKEFAFDSRTGFGRIESHGDVKNVIQARNYIRMIRTHKHLKFTVWSKNPAIWNKALLEEGGKPDNMLFVLSSPFYNKVMTVPDRFKWFIDKVFTVYTLEYAIEHKIKINCGGRKCKHCLKCYENTGSFFINELEKGDVKQAVKVGFDIGA